MDLDSFRLHETFSGSLSLREETGVVEPLGDGGTGLAEEELDLLSAIIKVLNATYGLNLTDEDKVDLEIIQSRLQENEVLQAVMQADNPVEVVRNKFDQVVDELVLEFVHTKLDLYRKLTDPTANEQFKRRWFEGYRKQFGNS